MTLIAGFHSFGTPVLIGDLLITRSGETVSYRKKILLISDNFAVAWTGPLFAAGSVIRSLQSSLSLNNITLESVREVLTYPETSNLGSEALHLIGWVIDARGQHCFLWNSLYPGELFSGAPQCDGSGSSTAEFLVASKLLDRASCPDHIEPDEDCRGALSVTTQLMAYEFWGPSTRPWGFGGAYEILYLVNGTHFKYLDNALYIPLACDLDERGRYIGTTFCASQFKYKADGNWSTFHINDPIARAQTIFNVPPPGPEPIETDGVIEDLRQRVQNRTYAFPFESDYYCFSLRLKSPVFETSRAFMVMPKHEAAQFSGLNINVVGDGININISGEWVEWYYKTIRLDITGRTPS